MITQLQSRLREHSNGRAKWLNLLLDGYCGLAELLYDRASFLSYSKDEFKAELEYIVQRARQDVWSQATADVRDELRILTQDSGRAGISLDMSREPQASDISDYVENAWLLYQERATEAQNTAYRANVIVETEAVNTYEQARRAAYYSIGSMPREQQESIGIRVLESNEDPRSVSLQSDQKSHVVLVAKMWNAVNDSRTCATCSGADGSIVPLGDGFGISGPPAHASCRCVQTLWPLEIVQERTMDTTETRLLPTNPIRRMSIPRVDFKIDNREIDRNARVIRNAIASDESIDSHGSIIKAEGWNLSRYEKNPVLLWSHAIGKENIQPEDVLGTAFVRVVDGKLLSDLRFSPEGVNPKADLVFNQMALGIIKGLSVGFVPNDYHFEKRDNDEVVVVTSQELIELSVVAVPSNANTLSNQIRDFVNKEPVSMCENCESCKAKEAQIEALNVQVAQLDCEVDATKKDLEAIRALKDQELAELRSVVSERDAQLVAAQNKLAEVEDRQMNDVIDSLIASGRLTENKRASASKLYKFDKKSFTELYPAEQVAPKAHLFERVIQPSAKEEPKHDDNDSITRRAEELMKSGMDYFRAFTEAVKEHKKS